METRGRPKGKSNDTRSYGPLGDLLRKHRLKLRLGLADVAEEAKCSVQFISNIEHGRAPLPKNRITAIASVLKIPMDDLQVAYLTSRADFKIFAGSQSTDKRIKKPEILRNLTAMASITTFASQNDELVKIIAGYKDASIASRKKFIQSALEMLK